MSKLDINVIYTPWVDRKIDAAQTPFIEKENTI